MAQSRRHSKTHRLAVYPGAFDPLTNGHLSLVERAGALFDKIIVGVATNAGKSCLFTPEERVACARKVFAGKRWIEVDLISGLTATYAKERGATAIIRGLRAVSDFEYEFQMGLMNRKMARDVETVFLMPSLSWVYLSSSLVKDVARHGGDVSTLVPPEVLRALKKAFAKRRSKTGA